MKKLSLFFALFCICVFIPGQSSAETNAKKIKIVTTLFPLYDFARNIGGAKAEVSFLLPPGMEAHDFEPRPADILKIDRADIFIYMGAFMEPWVKDALQGVDKKSLLVIDASCGITLAGNDPHIWLDFSHAAKIADGILLGFIQRDPENKNFYTASCRELKMRLSALDEKFKRTLSKCNENTFIYAGHFAFGYLANRYNLKFVSAYRGLGSEAEPSPRDLAALTDKMRQGNIRYVYYEGPTTPRMAGVIAQETGAKLLSLRSAHNISKEELREGLSFITLMERNLANLKVGLQCQ
jgi:zinc transport system substrate-binding protein